MILRKISLFFLFFIIINCSFFHDIHEVQRVKGRICITGNEPFTQLTLEDKEENIYYLNCNEKIKNQLWDLQGKEVLIYYVSINYNKVGKFITVKKYSIINKEHLR